MNWLDLCRNRPCIACGADDGTIVPAHSNQQAHGKGKGIKSGDWTVIPCCASCHFQFDHVMPRDKAREFWAVNWAAHMAALCQAELVTPAGMRVVERRPRPLTKILQHPGYSR